MKLKPVLCNYHPQQFMYVLMYVCMKIPMHTCIHTCCHFSHVQLCATLWIAAHQAPLFTGFSRQEYWSGLQFPSLKILMKSTNLKEQKNKSRVDHKYISKLLRIKRYSQKS